MKTNIAPYREGTRFHHYSSPQFLSSKLRAMNNLERSKCSEQSDSGVSFFVFKNADGVEEWIQSSLNAVRNGSPHDCTGKLFASSGYISQVSPYKILVIQSWGYDI